MNNDFRTENLGLQERRNLVAELYRKVLESLNVTNIQGARPPILRSCRYNSRELNSLSRK